MTSNIGADLIKRGGDFGFNLERDESEDEKYAYEEMRKKLMDALKKSFRPEFINRMDSVIVFHALNKAQIRKIAIIEIEKVAQRLTDQQIELTATDAALEKLSEKGYNPEMGARPLRRVIQVEIEDQLSDALLAKKIKEGDQVWVDVDSEGGFILTPHYEKEPEQKEPLSIGL
jgi:ATP-dependent Clp protease ATP-binding subunit ClpC